MKEPERTKRLAIVRDLYEKAEADVALAPDEYIKSFRKGRAGGHPARLEGDVRRARHSGHREEDYTQARRHKMKRWSTCQIKGDDGVEREYWHGCICPEVIHEVHVTCGEVGVDAPIKVIKIVGYLFAGDSKHGEVVAELSAEDSAKLLATGFLAGQDSDKLFTPSSGVGRGVHLYASIEACRAALSEEAAKPVKVCDSCKKDFPSAGLSRADRSNAFWRCPGCTSELLAMLNELDREDGLN